MQVVCGRLVARCVLLCAVSGTAHAVIPSNFFDQSTFIAISADQTQIDSGQSVTLSWASANAEACVASGGWSGARELNGFFETPPLTTSTAFTLTCSSGARQTSRTVDVLVLDASQRESIEQVTSTFAPGSGSVLGYYPTNTWASPSDTGTQTAPEQNSESAVTPTSSSTPTTSTAAQLPTTNSILDQFATSFGHGTWSFGGLYAITGWTPYVTSEPVTATTPAPEDPVTEEPATTTSSTPTSEAVAEPEPAPEPAPEPEPALEPEAEPTPEHAQEPEPAPEPEPEPALDPDPAPEPEAEPEPAPDPEPAPEPSLQLSMDDAELRPGEATTLRWSGEHVSNCRGSGAWSGSLDATGNQSTGALEQDATYTITCDGQSQTLMATASVLVTAGGTTISWQAPTENVDGSPLEDLATYRIYAGTESQRYDQQFEVSDPRANSYFVPLTRGDYHIAMTAVDADGNESGYSNEVIKSVY